MSRRGATVLPCGIRLTLMSRGLKSTGCCRRGGAAGFRAAAAVADAGGACPSCLPPGAVVGVGYTATLAVVLGSVIYGWLSRR